MGREAKLIAAVGKKGVGKTYRSSQMMREYVKGNPSKGVQGRRVLIFDVNDEYVDVKALSLKDVIVFSIHPKIEMRRIRPFHPDGRKMGIRDLQNTLFLIKHNISIDLIHCRLPEHILNAFFCTHSLKFYFNFSSQV